MEHEQISEEAVTNVSGITSQKIRQMTPKYRQFASLIVLRGSKIFVKRRRNMVLLCVEDSSSSRQNVKCHTLFS